MMSALYSTLLMYNALHDNQVLKFCSDDNKHSIDYVRSYRGRDGMVVGFINIYAIANSLLKVSASVVVFNTTFNNISVISWQSVFSAR
jgi:hypothetical protein